MYINKSNKKEDSFSWVFVVHRNNMEGVVVPQRETHLDELGVGAQSISGLVVVWGQS